MSDKIHSPKRLLVEAARRTIRDLNNNLVMEIADQARCRERYERMTEFAPEHVGEAGKAGYLKQMENHNDIITELKRKLGDWEQALSFALDLLEQD